MRLRGNILHLFIYGLCLALLLFLLRWLELRFLVISHSFEIYAGAIALLFTGLGIWLAVKLTRPATRVVVIEKPVPPQRTDGASFVPDPQWMERTGLSGRELEVLSLMAQGLTNQEIAGRLFLSQNTIKSHSARLFEKLEVSRRTQAIEKGRRMGIIP